MTITTIALSKLEPSPVNVRKTGRQSIDDLAASIEAHGLIQSLTVRETEKGKFEVIAGGRRLSALTRLMKEKRSANGEAVTKNFAIPCRVLADEDATEISLAENAIRQAMHPADQFEAFRALAEGGMSPGDIAARFGVSDKIVEQRLKLARVSPKLLTIYREGEMTLEQLEAFTVSDDPKRQEKVWKALGGNSYNSHPHNIRRQLTEAKVSATDQKARLIGLDAYLAAGGTVTRDLFSKEEGTYLDDPELVDRLVSERLEAEAEAIKVEGWAWVRVFPERFWPSQQDLRQIAAERPLTPEEEARLADLTEQRNAIAEVMDAAEDGGSAEQHAKFDRLNDEINDIEEIDRADWSAFDKASAGAAISFDWDGNLTITRGLVSRDESKTAEDMANVAALPLSATGKPAKPKPEFSATLLADLSAQRTMAMRAEMATNPTVALDTLIWTLALREFFHGTSDQWCAKISATRHFSGMQRVEDGRAAETLNERCGFWALRLPQEAAALWQWVRDADQPTKLNLLAYLVATSLDATQANGAPATTNSDAIHEALGLDMARYFEPILPDYLDRVNRTQVLEAVEEAVSPAAARELNGMKKAGLVEAAAAKLQGTGWLPKPLRLAATEVKTVLEEAA